MSKLVSAPLRFAAFASCAEVAPAADALVDDDRVWSYEELDATVAALTDTLGNAPRDGRPVAVLDPRSAAGVAGVIAASRAGRAFLAVDAMLPAARQTELIADSGARLA
ncbi:MAG: AMP-binding protein, partial [Stackebrandtia sp.]